MKGRDGLGTGGEELGVAWSEEVLVELVELSPVVDGGVDAGVGLATKPY